MDGVSQLGVLVQAPFLGVRQHPVERQSHVSKPSTFAGGQLHVGSPRIMSCSCSRIAATFRRSLVRSQELFTRFQAAVEQLDSQKELCKAGLLRSSQFLFGSVGCKKASVSLTCRDPSSELTMLSLQPWLRTCFCGVRLRLEGRTNLS